MRPSIYKIVALSLIVSGGALSSCKQRRTRAAETKGTLQKYGEVSRVIYRFKDDDKVYLVRCPEDKDSNGKYIYTLGKTLATFDTCNHLDEDKHAEDGVESLDFFSEYYPALKSSLGLDEVPLKTDEDPRRIDALAEELQGYLAAEAEIKAALAKSEPGSNKAGFNQQLEAVAEDIKRIKAIQELSIAKKVEIALLEEILKILADTGGKLTVNASESKGTHLLAPFEE